MKTFPLDFFIWRQSSFDYNLLLSINATRRLVVSKKFIHFIKKDCDKAQFIKMEKNFRIDSYIISENNYKELIGDKSLYFKPSCLLDKVKGKKKWKEGRKTQIFTKIY